MRIGPRIIDSYRPTLNQKAAHRQPFEGLVADIRVEKWASSLPITYLQIVGAGANFKFPTWPALIRIPGSGRGWRGDRSRRWDNDRDGSVVAVVLSTRFWSKERQ